MSLSCDKEWDSLLTITRLGTVAKIFTSPATLRYIAPSHRGQNNGLDEEYRTALPVSKVYHVSCLYLPAFSIPNKYLSASSLPSAPSF